MSTSIAKSFDAVPALAAVAGRIRRVNNNTFQYQTEDGRKVTRLHQTDIVVEQPDGRITLDSGGWKTNTTRDRMNQGLLDSDFMVVQDKGVWYVTCRGEKRVAYFDGVTLPDIFLLEPLREDADKVEAEVKAMRKAIQKFVKEGLPYGQPVPVPSDGDCWICKFEMAGATKQDDHLLSHVEEGYMHGSLVVLAMRSVGHTDFSIRYDLGSADPWSVDSARRAVRKFLYRRLGV